MALARSASNSNAGKSFLLPDQLPFDPFAALFGGAADHSGSPSPGSPSLFDDGPSAHDQTVDAFVFALTGGEDADSLDSNDQEAAADRAETNRLRELCRNGNPFPLIARQWPEFLITDPAEAAYFEGELPAADGTPHPTNPCLRLDIWQRDILLSLFDDEIAEIAVKGNTKAGKGMSFSIGINLWFDVFPESKVVLTSQRHQHAVDVIFGEVSKWRPKMQHAGPGKLLATGMHHNKQHYLAIANPQSGEGFSGQHGPRTLFVFDEATSVPGSFYDDAQKQARKIIAAANPRTLSGWFRDLYRPCVDMNMTQTVNGPFGKRRCVTVSGLDCLNVRAKRLERPIGPPGGIEISGRTFAHNETIPRELFELVKPLIPEQCDYGRYRGICEHPDKRHVAVFAHGQFPTEDPAKQVILLSWLTRHEEAWKRLSQISGFGLQIGDTVGALSTLLKLMPVECFGLDVARSLDGDKTVLTAGGIKGVVGWDTWQFNDVNFHAGEVVRLAQDKYGVDLRRGRNPVCVDCDGLGAGVADILRSHKVWVIEFRGNAGSTVDPRRYANQRAEAYGTLGRRLDPNDQWQTELFPLPPDDELRAGLTAPEKIYSPSDPFRFRITPKNSQPGMPEDMLTVKQKLGGLSPDIADSFVYFFHGLREMHALNDWFAQYTGPLIVYPAPPVDGDKARENGHFPSGNGQNGDDLAPPDGSDDGEGGANGQLRRAGAAEGQQQGRTNEQAAALMAWIEARYGVYGRGDGEQYVTGEVPAERTRSAANSDSVPSAAGSDEIFRHDVRIGGASGRVSVTADDPADEDEWGE